MSAKLPDVFVIRGAPGSGKSETAKCLAARLGKCVRVEVDTIRAMVIPTDWTNQTEHINVLSLTVELVAGFIRMGHSPVIVVDTFSGKKLFEFLAKLKLLNQRLKVSVFSLVVSSDILRERVNRRPSNQFKDIDISEKQNSDIMEQSESSERLIDNSELTPVEVVDLILFENKHTINKWSIE